MLTSVCNSGVYGVVKCYDNGTAVKHSRPTRTEECGLDLNAISEIGVMSKLQHPNVISVLDYGFNADGTVYMTMPYASCTLADFIRQYHATDRTNCFAHTYSLHECVEQIIAGLAYCHQHHVIHGDLTPANILWSNKQFRLGDFGLAQELYDHRDTILDKHIVTTCYRAPELWAGITDYGTHVDAWALGCIVYEMWTGHILFKGDVVASIIARLGQPGTMYSALPECATYFTVDTEPVETKDVYPEVTDTALNMMVRGLVTYDYHRRYIVRQLQDTDSTPTSLACYMYPGYPRAGNKLTRMVKERLLYIQDSLHLNVLSYYVALHYLHSCHIKLTADNGYIVGLACLWLAELQTDCVHGATPVELLHMHNDPELSMDDVIAAARAVVKCLDFKLACITWYSLYEDSPDLAKGRQRLLAWSLTDWFPTMSSKEVVDMLRDS